MNKNTLSDRGGGVGEGDEGGGCRMARVFLRHYCQVPNVKIPSLKLEHLDQKSIASFFKLRIFRCCRENDEKF